MRLKNKRLTFYLVISLWATASAWAQFTTVTGTITDPNGIPYVGATISASIIASGGSPTLSGLTCCNATPPLNLDSTGSFTMRLEDNNVVLPAGSQWKFTVSHPGVPAPFGFGPRRCGNKAGMSFRINISGLGVTLLLRIRDQALLS